MGGEGGAGWGPLVALSAAGARRPGTHCCFGTGGQVIDRTRQILKQTDDVTSSSSESQHFVLD